MMLRFVGRYLILGWAMSLLWMRSHQLIIMTMIMIVNPIMIMIMIITMMTKKTWRNRMMRSLFEPASRVSIEELERVKVEVCLIEEDMALELLNSDSKCEAWPVDHIENEDQSSSCPKFLFYLHVVLSCFPTVIDEEGEKDDQQDQLLDDVNVGEDHVPLDYHMVMDYNVVMDEERSKAMLPDTPKEPSLIPLGSTSSHLSGHLSTDVIESHTNTSTSLLSPSAASQSSLWHQLHSSSQDYCGTTLPGPTASEQKGLRLLQTTGS
ncbi:hypothetical protein FEM48_Zijuj05G0143500 [Ziziphus jujuba var. spinosa]|uniref:Uncharacterized protein n=1 Tax=Ziziphus jujuba var. spinosa TaxID=714518 RepID=A0A978VFB5_ZIZJJ|nr:hypothetical protein FEM48_Zijuj05G0143500 [Ziziphus jujuba var. spinosa]